MAAQAVGCSPAALPTEDYRRKCRKVTKGFCWAAEELRRSSIIRNGTVLECCPRPLVRLRLLRFLFQPFLVHLHAQARAGRQSDVAVLVELPLHAGDFLGVANARIKLVDQE